MQKNIFLAMFLVLAVVFPLSANADTLWSANGLNIYNINTGNIGLGTSNPVQKLDLGNGTGGTGLGWGGTTGLNNYANIFAPYSSGGIVLGTGIKGNTVADTYLSSYGSAQRRNAIRLNVSGDNGIQFYTNPVETIAIGSTVTMNERMRINAVGNVGIGTKTPGSKLDVNGSVNISGNLKLTGNIISDGDICVGVCQ